MATTQGSASAVSDTPRRLEDLPEICSPSDILGILPLGRGLVYKALADGSIPSARVGSRYLISRAAFIAWLSQPVPCEVEPDEAKGCSRE